MKRSQERILTTHTGSLPRPAELVALYARRAQGEAVDAAAIAELGRAATRLSIAQQRASGIDVGNNGEQQREGFFLYVFKAMLEREGAGRVAVSNFAPPRIVSEIRYRDPATAEIEPSDFESMLTTAGAPFEEAFLTAPSPGIIAAACKNEFYATEEAYLDALAEALRLEYEAIVRRGFVLQLDCPDLALESHISYWQRPEREFLGFVERVVTAINRALRNIPADRVRLHVCWGNYEAPHDCDVPLERIWPIIRQARVGGFVLPFANGRHAHESKVLRAQPLADDQLLVAGVVDVLTNFVEHPEVIADRIERVARDIGDPHRVLAGTDCGFDTSAGMGRVAPDVVWAKLRSLSEGARLASTRLL
jgi:5-methyltetrahydropteroyltriglutamate--homocysteine methyltransferase